MEEKIMWGKEMKTEDLVINMILLGCFLGAIISMGYLLFQYFVVPLIKIIY